MKKRTFDNQVSVLSEAIKNNRLVVFAGAGISKDSGIPLWNELINEVKNYLNEPIEENDSLKIAQMLYNEKGEKEYYDIVQNILFKNTKQYNPLHELILDLEPQHIITTNYDNYFENVIENKGLPFSIVSKDLDLPYAEHNNLLIKYHGDFENKNIVFKETDYLEFSQNNTLKETFVKSLFSNKIILFIGYSVGDVNLKLLIRDIQHILKKHHQRTYLLRHHDEISKSEMDYFKNLGINVIGYSDEALKVIEETEKLSSIGSKTYKQLSYIRDFDVFEHNRNKTASTSVDLKLIDDLHTSLKRFDSYRIIPKHILVKLYPFKTNEGNNSYYSYTSKYVTLDNYELYELFDKYKGRDDENFSDEYRGKLNYVLSTLLHSGVQYIEKSMNKEVAKIGNRKRKDKTINIFSKYYYDKEFCDCFQCTFDALKYAEISKRIEVYRITENTSLDDDMSYAYVLYQMKEYYKSYVAFEEIELKANKIKQMDISFICKFNLKRLQKHLRSVFFNDDRYTNQDRNVLINKSEKINLDKAISDTKYSVDKSQLEFLLNVKSGTYIQLLCNDMDDIYGKVLNDIEMAKNGGSFQNSNYSNLYTIISQLNSFLNKNYILGNGFSAIGYNKSKSIKAFLLGYSLNKVEMSEFQKFSFGISTFVKFNSFLLKEIIDYNNPEELCKYIRQNKLRDIEIDTESHQEIALIINNFFNNVYITNTIWKDKSKNSEFINYLNINTRFRKKFERQFQNICTVVTYFKFNQNQIQEIYSNINQLFKFTDICNQNTFRNYKFLLELYRERISFLSPEIIEETLEILNSKRIFNQLYINVLSFVSLKGKNYMNKDIDLSLIDYEDIDPSHMRIIYYSMEKEKQVDFLKRLNAALNESFRVSVVGRMLIEKIPTKGKIRNKYIDKVHEEIESLNSQKVDNVPIHILEYFHLLYSNKTADFGRKRLMEITTESNVLNFLINPEYFEPNLFDINWLKKLNNKEFLKRFSKVDYIENKLEAYLIDNKDNKLTDVYFKMKRFR